MCAATLLEQNDNLQIDLFEKNTRLGVKVAISGGGRCNVTTGINELPELLSKYVRGHKFLKPAFLGFGPLQVREWFGAQGVPLKEEDDRRVFPVSDRGADIVDLFVRLFQDKRITLRFREPITAIRKLGEGFALQSAQDVYEVDKLVITTGGNAYRHTGSSGDGYDFARVIGHTTTSLGPSLNSFVAKESWCRELSGISFPQARLSVGTASVTGAFLFTHFGISGPAAFALAAHIPYQEISSANPVTLQISLDANKQFSDWDAALQKALADNGAKQLLNVVAELVPQKVAAQILELAGVSHELKAAAVSKEQRRALVHFLSGELSLTLIQRRPGDEFVTAGGIDVAEVSAKTMQSRLHPDVYFAGEVLDIDGLTGGFNLQAAWATGRLAGLSILRQA